VEIVEEGVDAAKSFSSLNDLKQRRQREASIGFDECRLSEMLEIT